jgi:hypothetical protein
MGKNPVVGGYLFPCVCLNCGAWYTREIHSPCPSCGQQPDPSASAFYEWCLEIEKGISEQGFRREEDRERVRKALVGDLPFELRHGWSDIFLALVSAIGLGVLSNASYDVIKVWLLSRRDEFLKTRFVADYDALVEITVDYLRQHPHSIKEFDFENDELKIKFNQSIKPLIEKVEQKAKIQERAE